MADKSFGVKELNLLNASGTPTITSPNNLNLNANNVAISTNVTIGGNLTVSNNIGISSLNVTGVSTFAGITTVSGDTLFTKQLSVSGVSTVNGISNLNGIVNIMSGLDLQTNGTLDIIGSSSSSGLDLQSNSSVQIGQNGFPNNNYATFTNTGVNLNYSGSTKLTTTNTGVNVTGAITVNGSALSITPTTSDIQVVYEITNQTSNSYYRFAGNGVDSSANNPDLFLERGKKYRFINNSGGNHPFRIQSDNSSTLYSTGVTNNNASTGNIDFAIRWDAPAQLYYKCGNHGAMLGNIYISGAGGGRGILTQNTTLTGSSMTFDNIPTWATRITVNLLEASVSGNDQLYVRLRAGSSSITSDYSCVSGNFQGNITSSKTDAFNINGTGGAQLHSGSMVIEKIDSAGLKYIQTHMFLTTNGNTRQGGGNLERSSGAAVDGIEITVEGSNTYDNGVVTIYYE